MGPKIYMMVQPDFAGPSPAGAVFSISAMQSSKTFAIDRGHSAEINGYSVYATHKRSYRSLHSFLPRQPYSPSLTPLPHWV